MSVVGDDKDLFYPTDVFVNKGILTYSPPGYGGLSAKVLMPERRFTHGVVRDAKDTFRVPVASIAAGLTAGAVTLYQRNSLLHSASAAIATTTAAWETLNLIACRLSKSYQTLYGEPDTEPDTTLKVFDLGLETNPDLLEARYLKR